MRWLDEERKIKSDCRNVQIKGRPGTWFVANECHHNGRQYFLLEQILYGVGRNSVIVDVNGNIVIDELWSMWYEFDDCNDMLIYYFNTY